jgi:tetratricopeptide (TPR) repeat protein
MDESQDLGWLIRDNSNRIRGPFKQAEIVQLIKKGQLKGKTEISRANSYWFAIEEKAELGRFLPDFNGGKPPPEAPTQMTATLTEADIQDRGVEITTFTALPKKEAEGRPKNESPEGLTSGTQQIEWLSDELAQEFGDDFGVTISVQTDASGLKQLPNEIPGAPAVGKDQPTPVATSIDEEKTQPKLSEEKAKQQEMLRRATVKADTLPSEHKSFQGDRPKPIDTLMRVRNPGPAAGHHSQVVNVPVEPEPAPKMFIEEPEAKVAERKRRRNAMLAGAGALVGVGLVGLIVLVYRGNGDKPPKVEVSRPARAGEEASTAVRQSIILHDLEGAKSALSDLEQSPNARGDANISLAQAIVKKEFLYDVEGALNALQTAKNQAKSKRAEAEIDNLLAVYSFDRDSASSAEMLRRNLEGWKDDPVFRYNLALSLLRIGRPQDTIPILDGLLSGLTGDPGLIEDAALAQAWALEAFCGGGSRDPLCRRGNDAESFYERALQANPNSAKARLGLALMRMRRGGIKASESDFRAFLDSAPDLDPPTRIQNFRKLANSDFYDFAHNQIVELNTPGQAVTKPSALIMAADAIISGLQLKTSEAGKILETALSAAPGDANVLKALGYLRWKEGRLNELVDALKDLRERNSFAVNFMLGKAYAKLRKRDLAEQHYRALVVAHPNRSEGHSLLGELLLEDPARIEDAKAEFQLALKKDPLDLVAWRGLQRAGAPIVLSPEIQKKLPF